MSSSVVLAPVRAPGSPTGTVWAEVAPRPRLPASFVMIPDSVRSMGMAVFATRGAGKSRLLGRLVAWQDFNRSIPLVLIDPLGGAIDNLLSKIGRQNLSRRRVLWERVRYVDMAGSGGRVIPWPIYYEATPGERLASRAQRLVDVLLRADPELARAPIQGRNALIPLATAVGIICCGLGVTIQAADSLITEPARWEGRLAALARSTPETAGAVAEISALWKLPPREQEMKTAAFRSKLAMIRLNLAAAAMYGAAAPGINWHEVMERKLAVLVDFRGLTSPTQKQFALLWVYASLITFIKQRGHGRHTPISLIIDELTYLTGTSLVSSELLTADVDELVNRLARSHSVWLTIAGQELYQLPEQVRATVLSMGTLLFGQTADEQSTQLLASHLVPYDPWLVKRPNTSTGWLGRLAAVIRDRLLRWASPE